MALQLSRGVPHSKLSKFRDVTADWFLNPNGPIYPVVDGLNKPANQNNCALPDQFTLSEKRSQTRISVCRGVRCAVIQSYFIPNIHHGKFEILVKNVREQNNGWPEQNKTHKGTIFSCECS